MEQTRAIRLLAELNDLVAKFSRQITIAHSAIQNETSGLDEMDRAIDDWNKIRTHAPAVLQAIKRWYAMPQIKDGIVITAK